MRVRRVGLTIVVSVTLTAIAAPAIAPNTATVQFRDHLYAPPMRVHVVDGEGRVRAPFVYSMTLVDRLERRFEEDRSQIRTLVWFANGRLVQAPDPDESPLLLLGADQLGRDVFSRLLLGARASLGVAVVAAVAALMFGALCGAIAGAVGGLTDEILMRVADFVLLLPALYVVLVLRALSPLVLSSATVFVLMTAVFALVGWPYVARGVRAIVVSERRQDYALAAQAVGVGRWQLLTRHLMPASYGFPGVQATLLVPGFILAEATLSFVGLGFTDPTPSWGVMLREASNIRAIADFPWLLSPAGGIVAVVLGVNMVIRAHEPLRWVGRA